MEFRLIFIFIIIYHSIFLSQAYADSWKVDWSTGTITASATGFGNPKHPDPYASAATAARNEVFGLLLTASKGINVNNTKKISDLSDINPVIEAQIEGLITNIFSVSEPKYKESGKLIEATVEAVMCIDSNGCIECKNKETLKNVIDRVDPPKELSFKSERACEPGLKDFSDRPYDGFNTLLISMEGVQGFIPALRLFPVVIRYTDGGGGYCPLISPGTLSSQALKTQGISGKGRIFSNFSQAMSQSPQKVIEVKAVKVDSDGTIYLSEKDGKYINFIDKRLNGVFSKNGNVSVTSSKAVYKVNK